LLYRSNDLFSIDRNYHLPFVLRLLLLPHTYSTIYFRSFIYRTFIILSIFFSGFGAVVRYPSAVSDTHSGYTFLCICNFMTS
jgi:hypothetical protein